MTPTSRADHLRAAAIVVGRLVEPIPANHAGRVAEALRILADTDRRATIDTGSRGRTGGRRAKGGHSDPTASAATARLDTVVRPRTGTRAQANRITSTVADLAETAASIRAVMGGAPVRSASLGAVAASIDWCLTIPHWIGAWCPPDDATASEVDHACRFLDEQAQRLEGLVNVVLVGAIRTEPKPEQPKLTGCRSCARFGFFVELAAGRYAHFCRKCGEFRSAYGVLPTERICRVWHDGSTRITPTMIGEATAKPRRTKAKRIA